jgi:hypothetical protein
MIIVLHVGGARSGLALAATARLSIVSDLDIWDEHEEGSQGSGREGYQGTDREARMPRAVSRSAHRFLGNIATPELAASPLQMIQNLWGGELPVFDSMDEANQLIGALIDGLWNGLTKHQKRSQPFRLTRMPMEPTAAHLGQFGRVRLEELDGSSKACSTARTSSIFPSVHMMLSATLPSSAR